MPFRRVQPPLRVPYKVFVASLELSYGVLLADFKNADSENRDKCQDSKIIPQWGKNSEHCSGPSTSENGKIWQKSGFSQFWLHWFLCGWACRGCVHNCCRACMCAVLS